MTDAEVRSFLDSDPPRPGILATTRADGRPHVAPVWYVVDEDGTIVFNTGETTVKGRNLRRTGWAAMTVDDDRPPFSFVMVEGPVTISADLTDVAAANPSGPAPHMGADRADEYGDRDGGAGELLVRLTPHKMVSAANLAE